MVRNCRRNRLVKRRCHRRLGWLGSLAQLLAQPCAVVNGRHGRGVPDGVKRRCIVGAWAVCRHAHGLGSQPGWQVQRCAELAVGVLAPAQHQHGFAALHGVGGCGGQCLVASELNACHGANLPCGQQVAMAFAHVGAVALQHVGGHAHVPVGFFHHHGIALTRQVAAQYGYASGRDSSQPNPGSAAQAGKSAVDNNFYAFGVYSAGLALQPRLNNLHVARAGIQFKPMYHFYWGRNLMTSVKYSIYQKGNVNYGISDNDASLASRDIGRGLDIQVVYDFRSDLKLFYAYGYFTPGSAYKEADAKTIHTHIVSLNFLF